MEPAKAGGLPLYEFFRAAGIQETAAAAYSKSALDQSINEEIALELADADWAELKLVLGDRRRVLNYVKSRKGGSSSKLPVEEASPSRVNDVPMILEGDIKYNVEAPIGSGHFGLVYRGRYKEGEVAIKILLDIDSEDFWKEARALHAITQQGHPNVLRFFGVCQLRNQMAFITEFMTNGSLKQYLLKHASSLTQPLLLHFARSAAAGMLHLSSMTPPVLHRDLAARNLLLGETDSEGRPTVRIADFGLARASADGIYHAAVKRKLPERCTAPEVWSRKGEHSIASDVYAFGVTLWEIFSLGLDPAWDNESLSIEKRKLLLPALVRSTTAPAERAIPPKVHTIIVTCCAQEPERRLTWREITQGLEELEVAARCGPQAAGVTTQPTAHVNSHSPVYIETAPASEAYVPGSSHSSAMGSPQGSPLSRAGMHSPSPLSSSGVSSGGSYVRVSPTTLPWQDTVVPNAMRTGLPIYSQLNMLPPPVTEPRYVEPVDPLFQHLYSEAPKPTPQAVIPPTYSVLGDTRQMAAQMLESSRAMLQASIPAGFPTPPPFAPPPAVVTPSYILPTPHGPIYSTYQPPQGSCGPVQPTVTPLRGSHGPVQPTVTPLSQAKTNGSRNSNGSKQTAGMIMYTLDIPKGFSELPTGVIRVFATLSAVNLQLAAMPGSRAICAVPINTQLRETVDSSLMSSDALWRQVRHGNAIGWLPARHLREALSSPRPALAVFKSSDTTKLVFYDRKQERLSTIANCGAESCKREFELIFYLAMKSYSPEACPHCQTAFSALPDRIKEAVTALHKLSAPIASRTFPEHPQHPLRWTYPGYQGGTWECNVCRKQGTEKVWHCASCRYDLCSSCFMTKGQPSCPSEHLCTWVDERNCGCDVCGEVIGAGPHWECRNCNWCCCDSHMP